MNAKNIFKKQNIMPIAVLVTICLIVALLLAVINLITAPEIERRKQAAIDAAFKDVLPEGENFEEIALSDQYPQEIEAAHKGDGGYVFRLKVKGKEFMTLMVGINDEGKIAGVKVVSESETPGYKDKILPYVTGENGKYNGMTADTFEKPDLESGATLTSNAVYNAVKLSLDAYTLATGGEVDVEGETLPKTDAEIISLAETLLGAEAGTLTDVTPEDTDNVKRIYRDAGRNNYAVYTVVMSQYGTVETETIVQVDKSGVVKGIKKLTWKTSDPMYGYVPPSQEEADAFFSRLVGTDFGTIDSVDVVTNATNTSGNLINALKEAITAVKTLAWEDTPTPEAEIIAGAAELLETEADALTDVTPMDTQFVKRVYRQDEKGYAAYIVVINERYGRVEIEALVHIDFNGKIEGIKKLTWKTSDPMYGYVPPSQEEADAFFSRLVGANADTVDSVEVVTGATNTSNSLVSAIKEAFAVVDGFDFEPEKSPAARIVGIVVLSFAALAFIGYLVLPKVIEIIKRRKNG